MTRTIRRIGALVTTTLIALAGTVAVHMGVVANLGPAGFTGLPYFTVMRRFGVDLLGYSVRFASQRQP